MKRAPAAAVFAIILATAQVSIAYLPSASEIRKFWTEQRELRGSLFLSYETPDGIPQSMAIYLRHDGLWAKRVVRNGHTRTVWKWGTDAWQFDGSKWLKSRRTNAGWDDWAFDPRIDVLLSLTPRDTLQIRGLGRHPDGYVWLYGARHDDEPGNWLGLLKNPIRPAIWNSENEKIGKVRFEYVQGRKYPDQIVFQRPGRPDFRLAKATVQWNPDPAQVDFVKPSAIVLDPASMPLRPEDDEAS